MRSSIAGIERSRPLVLRLEHRLSRSICTVGSSCKATWPSATFKPVHRSALRYAVSPYTRTRISANVT
jgi:hypothetical protein